MDGPAASGGQQLVAEQLPDGSFQRVPRGFVVVRAHQQVSKHLTGATEAKKLLDRRGLKQSLVGLQARHGRDVHRAKRELPQRIQRYVLPGPDIDLLGAVGDELHGHRPSGVVPELDLDLPPVPAVRPEQVEALQRYRRECLSSDRRPGVTVAPVEVVELPPPLEGERPRRDRLEHRRLAGVVGAGQHHVPRQVELHLVEALEAADTDRADHVLVPPCRLAPGSDLGPHR